MVQISIEEAERVNSRIVALENAIKRLPIYIHNGREMVISTESPDLKMALEDLIQLASINDEFAR